MLMAVVTSNTAVLSLEHPGGGPALSGQQLASRELFCIWQRSLPSSSAGTAASQIPRLLRVSGETKGARARDLWVLIGTNQENTENSRGPACFSKRLCD